MAAAIAETFASCKVALSNNHMMSSNERTAMTVPPGNRNTASGTSRLARNTGNARHVAAYVKSRAIALMVSAATNELFNVKNSINAAVIKIDTHGVKNFR